MPEHRASETLAKSRVEGIHLEVSSVQSRLRALRLQKGLDETQFAQALATRVLAVSSRDVQSWESAESRPSAAQMERISQVTGRDVAWIKTGRDSVRR